MKLIGLAGGAGAGKNTAAATMDDALPLSVATFAIAAPLYQALGGLMGIGPLDDDLSFLCQDREFKAAPNRQLGGLSPRHALQQFGDWVRETLGQDYLLSRLTEELRHVEDLGTARLAIITDVRTEAECAWIRQHGGLVVHVHRSGANAETGGHHTEQPLTYHQGDGHLLNEGTVEELQERAGLLAKAWMAWTHTEERAS